MPSRAFRCQTYRCPKRSRIGEPHRRMPRANASIDQIRQELIGELPDTADRANPSDADATRATEILRQAQKFIETGRSSAAIAALRQSLRLDPSSVQAWRQLACC